MAQYEGEGIWRTVSGRRIFIRNGQSLDDAMQHSGKFDKKPNHDTMNNNIREKAGKINIQSIHLSKIAQLNDAKYSDGTYDLDTMKPVEFKSGYQVSFYQTGVKLSDADYLKAHNEMMKYSDGKTYAGKFGGEPEISYHLENKKDAIRMMKLYNQHSIAQFTKTGKVRFYYNYELDEEKNKTLYKKGGH